MRIFSGYVESHGLDWKMLSNLIHGTSHDCAIKLFNQLVRDEREIHAKNANKLAQRLKHVFIEPFFSVIFFKSGIFDF